MIVYGDPRFRVTLEVFARHLLALLDEVTGSVPQQDASRVDAARRLLIACGQCEQGVEDFYAEIDASQPQPPRCREAVIQATDAAAELFLHALHPSGETENTSTYSRCRAALDDLLAESPGELPLTIKVPEGYAFYLLMPEQYLLAARQWLANHADVPKECVAVIGLRSIGTGLSALVAAALRQEGHVSDVRRVTVRPYGHPFAREVTLPDGFLPSHAARADALIVDEGPGLSGSSMAAAHAALTASGFAAERIAFLPGHGGWPGGQGSEQVQRIWANAPRAVVRIDELRWDGESLTGRLARRSREIAGLEPPAIPGKRGRAPDSELHDIGGGAWRAYAYGDGDQSRWPAVAPQFERPKYLWRRNGESQGGIAWSFAGLSETLDADGRLTSTDRAAGRRMSNAALSDLTVSSLAVEAGFVASPWIDGTRLEADDINDDAGLLRHLAGYCAAVSLPPLDAGDASASWSRLSEMLFWNTKERLGDEWAKQAQRLADAASAEAVVLHASGVIRAYGDGRMAPHEWLRCEDGKILKTDSAGHESDHTVVGRQPIWWDVAGICVEWQLAPPLCEAIWREVQAKLGIKQDWHVTADERLARFYRASYAAFRIGVVAMAENQEPERCGPALTEYDRCLAQALDVEATLPT